LKKILEATLLMGILGSGLLVSAAESQPQKNVSEWRFPVGLTYNSGFSDVVDYYETAYDADSTWMMPVGPSFTPYYQFAHGSRIGIDVGPATYITIDGYYDEATYWDLPTGISYGFNLFPQATVSPYAKIGIKYHIAGGDSYDSSSLGGFGAIGVEIIRTKIVGIQAEIGYDASEITFSDGFDEETVNPGGFNTSIRALF
jgi:hypothetical protein